MENMVVFEVNKFKNKFCMCRESNRSGSAVKYVLGLIF